MKTDIDLERSKFKSLFSLNKDLLFLTVPRLSGYSCNTTVSVSTGTWNGNHQDADIKRMEVSESSFQIWVNDMLSFLQVEKLRSLRTCAVNTFSKCLGFLHYMEKLNWTKDYMCIPVTVLCLCTYLSKELMN